MLLERTIGQLDVGDVPPEMAEEMGHLGYAQWLGALRGNASYLEEAKRACDMARPFIHVSPAVAVFHDLLATSIAAPLVPLDLKLLRPTRRGGTRARRGAL